MTHARAAVAADAAAIAAVGREAFTRQYEGLVDPANYTWAAEQWYSDDAIRASIIRCQRDPSAHFLVAENEGEVLGFLQYDETGAHPELHRIYVSPTAQGSGVGSTLMNALHQQLPPTTTYLLVVAEGNDQAIRFYERHGLQQERRVSGHHYYRETAGVVFPTAARDFGCIVMRYRSQPPTPRGGQAV